jgi:hypothetical protein
MMGLLRNTLVILLSLGALNAHAAWYNSSWLYRKKLTVQSGKVTGTVSDLQAYVSFADSDILAKGAPDYSDLVFTLVDGTTKLDHEFLSDAIGSITEISSQSDSSPFLQGITKDPAGNFYTSAKNTSYPGRVQKFNSSWVLQASRQMTTANGEVQIADCFYKEIAGTGYLFVSDASVQSSVATSQGAKFLRLLASDLSYDSTPLADLESTYLTEGVSYYNSSWWASTAVTSGTGNPVKIRRYDDAYVFQKMYSHYGIRDLQGLDFIEIDNRKYLIGGSHNAGSDTLGYLWVYKYDDAADTLSYVGYLLPTATANHGQGLFVENRDGSSVWFADREHSEFNNEDLSALVNTDLRVFVEIPSVAVGTEIYVYYGNAAAANQENITGTWPTDYKMVMHMDTVLDTTSSITLEDSTGTNDGVIVYDSLPVLGKYGNAVDIEIAEDIELLTDTGLQITGDMTISVWAKYDSIPANYNFLVAWGLFESGSDLEPNNYLYSMSISSSKKLRSFWEFSGGQNVSSETGVLAINPGEWHHFVITRSVGATSELKFYLDGVLNTTNSGLTNTSGGGSSEFYLTEANPTATSNWNGAIQGLKISTDVKDASWIEAEYNATNDPSSFWAVGVEENEVFGGGLINLTNRVQIVG